MPPRRSARVAAAAELRTSALSPLPLALAQRIFLLLPVDARARAACVCRGWRAVLADPALWTRLDLSCESGVNWRLDTQDALLQGAAGRAHGQLAQLYGPHNLSAALQAVVAANAGSLRELHVHYVKANPTLQTLLDAAPQLQHLHTEYISCTWEDAPRLVRAEAPFALLRFRKLSVDFGDDDVAGGVQRISPFAAALAVAASQPELSNVCIRGADTQRPEVMNALVDAALARRLRSLEFCSCTPPAAAPMTRLLAGESLTELKFGFRRGITPLFDAAGAALVAAALRANTSLTQPQFDASRVCANMQAMTTLSAALVGHPTLRALMLIDEWTPMPAELGAALATLVDANAPALQRMGISGSALGDDGMTPLMDALPRNNHLRELDFIGSNAMTEGFANEQLLPAVRANTLLRMFICREDHGDVLCAAVAEAEELVRRRPPLS